MQYSKCSEQIYSTGKSGGCGGAGSPCMGRREPGEPLPPGWGCSWDPIMRKHRHASEVLLCGRKRPC